MGNASCTHRPAATFVLTHPERKLAIVVTVFVDPDMEATMVTDLFKIETTKELKNSTDYHAKALELGLVRVHMQGYRDGMYDEAIEATNKAIKELYGSDEENGTTPLVLFPDDIESKHREYGSKSNLPSAH